MAFSLGLRFLCHPIPKLVRAPEAAIRPPACALCRDQSGLLVILPAPGNRRKVCLMARAKQPGVRSSGEFRMGSGQSKAKQPHATDLVRGSRNGMGRP